MQKQAVRYIVNAKHNSHTDPLFRSLEILKFDDLVKYNSAIFMFNLAMGTQPLSIASDFTRGEHFNRNLNWVVEKTPYVYLDKNAPVALVKLWNSLNFAHRNWLKEVPENKSKKKSNIHPYKIPDCNNRDLNKFRLKGFKKSLSDTFIDGYKQVVGCNNKFCKDCTG